MGSRSIQLKKWKMVYLKSHGVKDTKQMVADLDERLFKDHINGLMSGAIQSWICTKDQ